MNTAVSSILPLLILLLLAIALVYGIVSAIRKKSNSSVLQGLLHFFVAIKTIVGVISLTVGVILVVYGFIEYNAQKNTLQGKLKEALSDKPDNTPILVLIGGACLIIIGLTLLLLKSKENKVVQYVAVPQEIQLREGAPTSAVASNTKRAFCGKCGTKIEDDNLFCSACGAKIS